MDNAFLGFEKRSIRRRGAAATVAIRGSEACGHTFCSSPGSSWYDERRLGAKTMPNTWENGGHVDHNPIVEARAAHLMGHQRRVARSAVAIQTGCRAACREQTAADVLEARKALCSFFR